MSEPMVFEPTISQENHDQFTEMVMDAAGPAFDWNSRDEPETPNPTAQNFFKMKDAADSPLWSGYSFYSSKKVVAPLGLGVEKIDACENDCMLYWKNEKELQQCYNGYTMDVKGKSKDNLNARLDLQSICKRWDLELKEVNEKYLKPKASYTLSKERQIVLKWIKNLRLPDGYVSNLARCVNLDDCSLHGMKSHDCHVFMQRLLPLAFRDLLPEFVWNGLTELSQLYDAEKQAQIPNLTHKSLGVMRDNEFATWFCNYVENPSNQITDNDIKQFSRGFNSIASVGDVYQELTSDPACIILDNELDYVAILTDANRQEEEVNPNELQPSRRELEEEFESDELEIGSMDLNEEELEEEESGNDNDLTSDDSDSGD
ncbi:hypothetical protein BUALT_Bualt16G0100100 [Buddleja alternifolia]|uniref:Uncharacterized protein n=1 Tax=Buddleja alternifolia TaxID=168488 RepID=A0AAV6WBZ6_9LAMI|nr:hypothetical protein BUALT_Bualt16G0100100 [Buddleja alternifolia]